MELRVGDDVSTQCGKCKQRTWHVVFAMDGAVVKRVQCKICMGYHNYKPDPSEVPAREVAPKGDAALRRRDGETTRKEPKAAAPPRATSPRAAAALTEPKTPGTRKSTKAKAVEPDWEAQWNEALKGKDLDAMVRYRPDGTFHENGVIEHPSFGVGVVLSVSLPPEKRMQVIFQGGTKQLVCRLGT